jgi:hypothetical protein
LFFLTGPLPLLLPGIVISVVAALVFARPVAQVLGSSRNVAGLLIFSLGLIAAATLTPDGAALFDGRVSTGQCDTSRTGLPPLRAFLRPNEASLNVLLFIPLGIAVALLPRTRRSFVVAVSAIALTFVIETLQLVLPALGRGCQTADLVDNLLGLAIGAIVGLVLERVARGLRTT